MDLVSASSEKLQPLPPSSPAPDGEEAGPGGRDGDGEWLENMEEKAERGITQAQFSLGQYHYERGCHGDALKHFGAAAEGGNMQAKFQLAVMHYDGVGVAENQSTGFSLMLAVAGSVRKKDAHLLPAAQYNVGRAYFQGCGVGRSDSEAAEWWEMAAKGGVAESSVCAQNILGMFYTRSESLDLTKSFYWHSEAAEHGHFESMAAVGLMRLDGQGCSVDEDVGLQWLRRSAEGASLYGTGLLALFYYSRKLFSKAAETAFKVSQTDDSLPPLSPLDRRGAAIGCFVLARCLQLGQAVSRSDSKAQEYFIKAKDLDRVAVAELYDKLTQERL